MLFIHSSNRLETLAGALATMLREEPLPPLATETIVTQSIGMSRWLCFFLAEKLGVAAQIEFPFPAKFAERELARLLPTAQPSPLYRREVLPWRIHSILPGLLDDPDFADLRQYAGDSPEKLWELAQQIAVTFDRYIAHRPQMLRDWDARGSATERWQAKLWRAIADGSAHPAALIAEAASKPPIRQLPRCAIFGLSSLAPTYLEFLAVSAAHRDVHLFLLAPTEHYWGDVMSDKEKARFVQWSVRRGKEIGAEHIQPGHPLLASLGKVGRDFHDALLDQPAGTDRDYFQASGRSSLLGRLQDDILELREGADDRAIADGDSSIQLHNCHSPLRELEVLHDQLLAMFEREPSLTPRDVLVAMPDVEEYAPFIEGVFGAPESESVRFPYSIADRAARVESGVTDAFLRALDLLDSRFPATTVLALLECPAVSAKFGIGETDLPLIRQWVVDSGIRWGRDAAHRVELGLPESREHTWQFGLDRLVLGFALPGDGAQLFEGILPEPAVEGGLAEILGAFAQFTATLFEQASSLSAPRTAVEWVASLQTTLGEMCEADNEFADEWRSVAESLADIAENATLARNEAAIPFTAIRSHVAEILGAADRGSSFLRGGITFCSMRPMRAIPHRVVCLLGMNDGAFPRQDRAPAFDITAAQPRPGDRSTRDDDRYLFLEAIISARDALLIFWCGQSPQDNSALPPSVVVAEFLDVLTHAYDVTPERLTTKHRLQPFSPRYFETGPLFSFSQENALGAASTLARSLPPPFGKALSDIEVPRDVTLDRLTDALCNSSRFFARERLGIQLPFEEAQPDDTEPMEMDTLDRYALSESLIAAEFRGLKTDALLAATSAQGALPHGYAGSSFFSDTSHGAQNLVSLAKRYAGVVVPPESVLIMLGEWRISGMLKVLNPPGILQFRSAAVKARDYLRVWIAHVALCSARMMPSGGGSYLIGTDGVFFLPPLAQESAREILAQMLDVFLALHSRPVPLFPSAAMDFAKYALNRSGRMKKDPLSAADVAWNGAPFSKTKPESADAWNALVWRDVQNPLDAEFEKTARVIFGPIVMNSEKLGGADE